MARPTNPLDKFVTYTTHFELHAATTFEELKNLASYDANMKTSPREATETLLINTRRDAHQTIDNVRYQMMSNGGDPRAAMIAATELSMNVVEPGGTFFIEKLQGLAQRARVTSLIDSMIFGLKIIFVGRLSDNTVVTEHLPYIIPLQLRDVSASFDFRGGEYELVFQVSSFAGVPTARSSSSLSQQMGRLNKNVVIKARTVKEAIKELEKKLNDNYRVTYETELQNSVGAKKISYKINYNLDVDGEIDTVPTESFKQGDVVRMTFHQNEDLATMVRRIIYSSKAVCEQIGASMDGLTKEFHPGVKIPTFTPRYHLKDTELELGIDVNFYEGGGNKFEFDFLFGEPGSNVDVMEFEMKLPHMSTNLGAISNDGYQLHTNTSSTVQLTDPKFYSENITTPNTTRLQIIGTEIKQTPIQGRENDVARLPIVTRSEQTGQASIRQDAVAARRLAFDATSMMCSAREPQVTFTIRGHLDILSNCVAYPDGTQTGFGTVDGMWVKVNIKDRDKQPFYYTGWYQVITVDNIFSQGKFIQLLTVIMMTEYTKQ